MLVVRPGQVLTVRLRDARSALVHLGNNVRQSSPTSVALLVISTGRCIGALATNPQTREDPAALHPVARRRSYPAATGETRRKTVVATKCPCSSKLLAPRAAQAEPCVGPDAGNLPPSPSPAL